MTDMTKTTDATVLVRPFEAAEWPTWRELRLRALADAPEAFCATLADAQARPDATWAELLARACERETDLALLALTGTVPAGLTWAQHEGDDVTVFQVWVAPEWRGRGMARALLEAAIAWAGERGAAAVCLSVTMADTPAVRLYRRLGFVDVGAAVPMANRSGLVEQAMRLELKG
jgi:ribosomal protein S18 acetylase RimI-like enzyme